VAKDASARPRTCSLRSNSRGRRSPASGQQTEVADGSTEIEPSATDVPERSAPISVVDHDDDSQAVDPVRTYLRHMQMVPLLTRESEVALAKRIEGGHRLMWQAALKTNVAHESLGLLCERVRREQLAPAEVFGAFKEDDEPRSQAGRCSSGGGRDEAIKHVHRLRGRLRKCGNGSGERDRTGAGSEGIRSEIADMLLAMRIRSQYLDSIVANLKGLLSSADVGREAGLGVRHGGRSPHAATRRALAAAGLGKQALRMTVAQIEIGERQANRAKEEMVRANLRLVVAIANRHSRGGLDLLDLVQEGNIGLMRAVDKFDYRLGYKFATYATWWIRQSIERALSDQSRTIRIPVHANEVMNRLKYVRAQLLRRLRREATTDELAAEMGLPAEKLEQLIGIYRVPVSLETPLGAESDRRIGDLVEDDKAIPALDVVLADEAVAETHRLLATLTPREEKVLRMRFGIQERDEHTLEQVGNTFSLTRERIRQIEAAALVKLRRSLRRP
jgi:RNA polymerase primary sigma factor